MSVNPSGWRPSAPPNEQGATGTVTGNRALMLEEPLIFEIGTTEQTGVDTLRNGLVVAVTETTSEEDIAAFETALNEVVR